METFLAAALIVAILMAGSFGGKALFDALAGRRNVRTTTAFAAPLSRETHWSRITSVVDTSMTRAAVIMASQEQAARQLDAADYALHSLLRELEDVMPGLASSPLERTPSSNVERREPARSAIAA